MITENMNQSATGYNYCFAKDVTKQLLNAKEPNSEGYERL